MKRSWTTSLAFLLATATALADGPEVERLELSRLGLAVEIRESLGEAAAGRAKAMAGFVLGNEDEVYGARARAGGASGMVPGPKLEWLLEPQSSRDGRELVLVVHNEGEDDVEIVRSALRCGAEPRSSRQVPLLIPAGSLTGELLARIDREELASVTDCVWEATDGEGRSMKTELRFLRPGVRTREGR